jgi:hypothetical protein
MAAGNTHYPGAFMNFRKHFFALLVSLMSIALLSGCVRINEGNFGIVKSWDKTYQNTPAYGLTGAVLDDVTEVYGRERLLQIVDARPKDKENVMLQDLDLTISYIVDPVKSIEFVRKRGDLKPAGDGVYVVGETYLQKDAKSVIGETVRKFYSEEILNTKRKVEEQFAKDLQQEVDTLYGAGVFKITEVKIANVIVADSIEERIQAVSLINAEKIKADAIGKILETRKAIQTKEMKVISDVARDSGLTVDQVLEARRLDILRDLPAGAGTVMINPNAQ